MGVEIEEGSVFLFQGDSITDAGRSREDETQLGSGYANMTAAMFSAMFPELGVTFLNRGVSGNRVKDLKARWDEDCLALEPDVVSILIGVNDTWRRYDKNDPTSAEAYEADYREILTRTQETGAQIVMLEPFVLPTPKDRIQWREDLDPKIAVARRLAREFADEYISLDGLFAEVLVQREPEFWAADGVHPTQAGHALIANALLQAIGAM